ncbi:MAG: FtsQ-type POTRA domain-containing protein [Clostridiaceae bacterium]|nr:FtsQ-type POTRA domain-containing protein [Clostridiaceae bacterium]
MNDIKRERKVPELLISEQRSQINERVMSKKALVVILSILILLIVGVLVWVLPPFYVKKIIVSGTRELSEEEIINSMGIEMTDHLLSNIGGDFFQIVGLRYGNIEEELRESFPYIESVKIRFSLPSTVKVEVIERQKIGYIDLPDGYAVIDKNGTVVELQTTDELPDVPMMLGLPINSVRLGEKIGMDNFDGFDLCIVVFAAVIDADKSNVADKEFQLMKCVRSVRYVDNKTIFLTMVLPETTRTISVKIGGLQNLKDDMNWLRHAVSIHAFDEMQGTMLDMTGTQYSLR